MCDCMPEFPAPGVYIEETSFRSHSIEGVSTSTTGFIGPARQGPSGEAIRITSFVEFEQAFGGVSGSGELGYAVWEFFLNGGREAWVVRVTDLRDASTSLSSF